MAKIAVELERALARRALHGAPGEATPRRLAQGDGWTVSDVICTSGPRDRPFEERHSHVSIAIISAGSFQYRSAAGRELMTPGSLLLGNAGQCFECGHDHGSGDRCLAFGYAPDYFERIASAAGFRTHRLPPVRALSGLVARACAAVVQSADAPWEELSIQLAGQAARIVCGRSSTRIPPNAVARVTRAVRTIDRHPDAPLTLRSLAQEARLSPCHFLRLFEGVTGLTPHQYVLRTRLRQAAMRLADPDGAKVLDIALDCGFGDISNFNRAFRAEFGASPMKFRRKRVH